MLELRPRKELLDPDFDGYKLSLEPVPIYRLPLECGADHILPSDDQYSFLHLKVFGLHNHLYKDPWTDDGIYFVDKKWAVQKIISDTNTGRLEGTEELWQIPSCQSRRPGHYNTSLCFPSEELALLSDGAGTLYIVETGGRSTRMQWKVLFSGKVCGDEKSFIIADSRFAVIDDHKEIQCVLLHVEEANKEELADRRSKGAFDTTLEWITFVEGETGSWSIRCVRCLSGPGGVNYIALEPGCHSLYLASEYPFEFIHDSENPVQKADVNGNGEKMEEGKKEYMWQQTSEDITLTLLLPATADKSDVTVDIGDMALHIAYRDQTLLNGPLVHGVGANLTTWTLETGKLEVNLVKQESGLIWAELVVGDTRGEQVMDPALVDEVHQRLAHLCSSDEPKERGCMPGFNSDQLEDCDAPPSTMAVLSRLDPTTHKASHQVNLGGLQWLLNTQTAADKVPAICLRHDFDGCVWQPETPGEMMDDWPFNHVATFLAFGYVQASKQQRKFSTCPSDLSYVAIVEAMSHVYIYRLPQELNSDLRNRRTGRRVPHVARQHLVNLDTNKEVLGVHASPHTLYILTTDTVLALHINI